MAEQIINVNCGFFDAVDNDRRYSADEMNMPYKRVLANGIFATPQGTPSTDLQVIAGSGMDIIVKAGNGIIGDKWYESAADIRITVPSNTDVVNRVDSVIAQVDARSSGRVGNVVYRTGGASAPDLDTTAGVYEFRLANITVAPNATEITDSVINDRRGSSECPWITSLIQQVDTSTLYQQWNDAYNRYLLSTTTMIDAYMAEQSEAWERFFNSATQSFTVVCYFKFTSQYTTTAESTVNVPINIPAYNVDTDILNVYINGLAAMENIRYTINDAGTQITLANALPEGQTVYFEALHAVLPTDISNAVSLINQIRNNDIVPMKADISELQEDVATLETALADSGWITLHAATNFTEVSGSGLAVRKIGKTVFLRGVIQYTGSTASDFPLNAALIDRLPAGYRPAIEHCYSAIRLNQSPHTARMALLKITASGYLEALAADSATSNDGYLPIATSFLTE